MATAPALDPRLNAYRLDLADERLGGRVVASRFVPGEARRVVAGSAPLKRAPRADAAYESEVLRGEVFTVFESTGLAGTAGGWSWGQLETDSYVGYVPSSALGTALPAPTHRVVALRAFVYPGPDLKAAPVSVLSFGAALVAGRETVTRGSAYREIDGGGWIAAVALAPLDAPPEADFVTVAERFLNTPYLWGGRTSLGLDCSALVQLALAAAGKSAPRDTDLQEKALGDVVAGGVEAALQRGDLVFWNGHVAILIDGETIVHASGHHMAVAVEPLRAVLDRIAPNAGPPTSVRRL